MTFSILNATTNKVVNRSNVRTAGDPASYNLRIDLLTTPEIVKSMYLPQNIDYNEEASTYAKPNASDASASSSKDPVPILDPKDLVGGFLFHKNMVNVCGLR